MHTLCTLFGEHIITHAYFVQTLNTLQVPKSVEPAQVTQIVHHSSHVCCVVVLEAGCLPLETIQQS